MNCAPDYPDGCDPEVPGCDRGPCPNDSGEPSDVENEQPDATVYFSVRGDWLSLSS